MNISINHEYRAKCVDEETETESIICGRGYGGVATFWRKSMDHAIKYYNDGNERINVITVNIKEQPLCIISVYMPSENSNRDEKYKDTMAQLEEIIDKFVVDHQIMICGDFNASVHRDNRSRDGCLKNFMESNQLFLTRDIQRNQLFSTTIECQYLRLTISCTKI
jgi:exonuclease III